MNSDFSGKKIAVLGAGVEGIASAAYLTKHGATVTLLDEKQGPEAGIAKELEAKGVTLNFGSEAFSELASYDLLVRSPGISLKHEALQGRNVTSQTQLFLELCPAPVIGVTGTKGKGTTSSLIYEMLKASGRDAYLGGNIGVPPFSFLDDLKSDSVVVLELSSFQLQDLGRSPADAKALAGKPYIAVMLMVVPEHLDYHADMSEYVEAKRNILRFQAVDDFAVINRDYVASHESDIVTDGQVFYVSRERETTEQGCYLKENAIWIRMKGTEWKIIDISDVALPGKHNLENACAAAMAATLAGAAKAEIAEVLRSFTGLPHRLELVREVNGVRYFDDSFSTTPETAIAAIESFKEPEILILGGSSKKSDFTELGKALVAAGNIKAIIGIGAEWPQIKSAIEQAVSAEKKEVPILYIEGATSMSQVVQAAAKIAHGGDVVLLSPACASFDMFKNYKVRGEQFKEAVLAL